jgi:hypothetical protein
MLLADDQNGNPTDHITTIYNFWSPAYAGCNTPSANLELMDYGGAGLSFASPGGFFSALGNLNLGWVTSSTPFGTTLAQAETFDCNGLATADPPDGPGYGAVTFGPNAEIMLEYNTTGDQVNASGVNNLDVGYKVIVRQGYYGSLLSAASDTSAPGGYDTYAIAVGALTKVAQAAPGATNPPAVPVNVDWTGGAATAVAGATELVNAFVYGQVDAIPDCTQTQPGASGPDCVISAGDATHPPTITMTGASLLGISPFGITFPIGTNSVTNAPDTVFSIYPPGQ